MYFREYPEEKFKLKDEDFKLISEGRIFSIDELSTRTKKVYVKEEEFFGKTYCSVCTEIDDRGVQETSLNFVKDSVNFFETEGDPHYEVYFAKKIIFGNIWRSVIPCRVTCSRTEIYLPY